MAEWNHEVCEIRHEHVKAEQKNIIDLIKAIHEGDEKFLAREVKLISSRLDKIPKLENRVNKLEKWKVYLLGIWGATAVLLLFIYKILVHLFVGA